MNYTEFLPIRKFITKEWCRQAVATAKVSGEYLAHQMGISHSLFSRMINPADPDRHIHFHNAAVLVKETGDFTPLDNLERVLGRLAFVLPATPSEAEVHRAIARVHQAVGRLVAAVGETDNQGIRYLGEQAIRALCTLMEAVP